MTQSGIAEIRYQHELFPCIWARLEDGNLIGCTYRRITMFSNQPAEFVGWHRHSLGSGRTVQSISEAPSVNGVLDTLGMTTLDPVTGIYHVEFLQDMFDVDAPITSAWFLDDAITPSGGYISLIGATYYLILNGLWHLNGKTVTAWIGGVDLGDWPVSNGSMTITLDPNGLLTFNEMAALSSSTAYGAMGFTIVNGGSTYTLPGVVGFTFTSQGQGLRPDTMDQARTQTGPGAGKRRRNAQYSMLVEGSQGLSVGCDSSFVNIKPVNYTPTNENDVLALNELYTGVLWDTIDDDSSFDGMLCWQLTRPYPSAIASFSAFLNVWDR
jgi:hypothetical protein